LQPAQEGGYQHHTFIQACEYVVKDILKEY